MILRIILIILGITVLIFIGYWLWSGGLQRAINTARNLDSPLGIFTGTSTMGGFITLPGQPDTLLPGYDIEGMMDTRGAGAYPEGYDASAYGYGSTDQMKLNSLQSQYDELVAKAKDPRNFGNPSPYRDQVTFGISAAQESSPTSEYVTLNTNYGNSAPVSLSGWSLQSAVTGIRVLLPTAAPNFLTGILNAVEVPQLNPGTSAYVVTGPSPVGVSFRENICSGYLGDLQTFSPELERNCPMSRDELPLNAQNIAQFGDACVDYAQNIPTCHFPGNDAKPSVSAACSNFLLTRFTYNGCVYAHRAESNFTSGKWRLYLASGVQLWRDTHDVVRLLDANGRTVDVLSY